jgi:hypothetical protein
MDSGRNLEEDYDEVKIDIPISPGLGEITRSTDRASAARDCPGRRLSALHLSKWRRLRVVPPLLFRSGRLRCVFSWAGLGHSYMGFLPVVVSTGRLVATGAVYFGV